MEAVLGRNERRIVRGSKRRGREKQQLSVHQLLRAQTVCWHCVRTCLWERGGDRRGGEGGVKREGRALERAVCVRPPPCPLAASHSTSGDLYVDLTELCQCAVGTHFIFRGFASHVLLACGIVGGKINGLAKCGV